MIAIYERELDSQMGGLTGYVYGALMLLFCGIYVMVYNLGGAPDFAYVLGGLTFILLIAIPLLTMRSIAEERHQKTDQLLYSLPLSMTKIVLGKYFALVTVMAIPLVIMCAYPVLINALTTAGTVPLKASYGALLGFFFLGLALTAIGLFVSSLMDNVALAAGSCFIVLLLMYFLTPLTEYISASASASFIALVLAAIIMGVIFWRPTRHIGFAVTLSLVLIGALCICYWLWQDSFDGLLVTIISPLAVFDKFDSFTYDIFDIRSLVYYVTVAAVFLFLTVQSMERRRWAS